MKKLLFINSSVRGSKSITRQLSSEFILKWKEKFPNSNVTIRDLALQPLPHISEEMVEAFFTPVEKIDSDMINVIKTSDMLVDELFNADVIVIGAPMYNLTIPSGLKAWIDHIARAGRTFQYSAIDPEGLVKGKKVIVFVSTGGDFSTGKAKEKDFVTTYLKSMFSFLGMDDVSFIVASGVAKGELQLNDSINYCRKEMDKLI